MWAVLRGAVVLSVLLWGTLMLSRSLARWVLPTPPSCNAAWVSRYATELRGRSALSPDGAYAAVSAPSLRGGSLRWVDVCARVSYVPPLCFASSCRGALWRADSGAVSFVLPPTAAGLTPVYALMLADVALAEIGLLVEGQLDLQGRYAWNTR